MANVKVLVCGDLHFKTRTLVESQRVCDEILHITKKCQPDFVVLLGDILDTMNIVHTQALNLVSQFFRDLSRTTTTFVIVGNHDYINNRQFLSQNHPFNSMKEWDPKIHIIDSPTTHNICERTFLFLPYIPPGMFSDALEKISVPLPSVSCIFCHQEFRGCHLRGGILSENGDPWPEKNPLVISGHIHHEHWVGGNIYYPGTPYWIDYGDETEKGVKMVEFNENGVAMDNIPLMVRKKIKKRISVSQCDVGQLILMAEKHDLRIVIYGGREGLNSLQKNKQFKKLGKKATVILENTENVPMAAQYGEHRDFISIFRHLVEDTRNPEILELFKGVV